MSLNIRYDAPEAVWQNVPIIYAQLDGWLGFGEGGSKGEAGIPYWFSYNENDKHISASLEPSGLQFAGLMIQEDWDDWCRKIKKVASEILGYKVGELELGEVEQ
jgi:hypothetical protein